MAPRLHDRTPQSARPRRADEIGALSTRQLSAGCLPAVYALTTIYAIAAVNRLIGGGGGGGRNLVPFQTIVRYLTDPDLPTQLRLVNLAGNLVLLAPLGLALAAATRLRPLRASQVLLAVAIAIEAFQFARATGRSVDIDDVILNTLGGSLGYLTGLIALGIAGAVLPSLVTDPRTPEPTVRRP